MSREFKLPDVGEDEEEAEVLKWIVEEGDEIAEDDPVVEVETERAIIEIPSPVTGRVEERHVDAGEEVPVGEVLVSFEEDEDAGERASDGGVEILGEEDGVGSESAPDSVFASPSTRRLARELDIDITEVRGSGPRGRITATDIRRAAGMTGDGTEGEDENESEGKRDAEIIGDEEDVSEDINGDDDTDEDVSPEFGQTEAPAVDPETTESTTMFGDGDEEGDADDEESVAPETSMFGEGDETGAGGADIDDEREADVDGTDTDGETETGEVEGTATMGMEDEGMPARGAGGDEDDEDGEDPDLAPEKSMFGDPEGVADTADTADAEGDEDDDPYGDDEAGIFGGDDEADGGGTDVGGVEGDEERIPYTGLRRRTGERLERAADVPHVTHHDTADVERLVEMRERLNDEAEIRLTYTPFIVRACTEAIKSHWILNSELDEGSDEIVVYDSINIGVATETDEGLVVPVVEDADSRNIVQLGETIGDLVERAREGDLSLDERRGGTFTVTNVGAIGGEGATPLVNYPETAIVAVGEISQRPRVVDGEVVPRHTMPLSVTFDHRVTDGAEVARFTNDLKGYLNEPERLLL